MELTGSQEEDRAAMVLQMKEECRFFSSDLDLDQIFKELQKTTEHSRFARIGPFGILAVNNISQDQIADQKHQNHAEQTCKASPVAAENIPSPSVAAFTWDSIQDLPPWEDFQSDTDMVIPTIRPFDLSEEVSGPVMQDATTALLDGDMAIGDIGLFTDDLGLSTVSSDLHTIFDSPKDTKNGRDSAFDLNYSPSSATSFWETPSRTQTSTPAILRMSNEENLGKIPAEARLLLDYYSTRMVDVISLSLGQKSPWKTIHLPCAMTSLGELLVHGEAKSFAKMSLFHALLSVSSFHIGLGVKDDSQRSQYWYERGVIHRAKAELFLKSASGKNVPKSNRGKYKELLMSILSMVTIGVSLLLVPPQNL